MHKARHACLPAREKKKKAYLALATHSMTASFLPMVTLVFFGGTMIDGAMGSAGPPTSITHTQKADRKNVRKSISYMQSSD